MATPAEVYINGIKKKLKNYFAAWLPNEDIKLGDIGVLDGNLFTRVTSLNKLGKLSINFQERPDTHPTPIDYVSESGVSFFVKATGESNPKLPNLPAAKAGVGIEFSREGSFVVQAQQSYEPSIEDIAQLEKDILNAYKQGVWEKNWAVIIRCVRAPMATIIISNSSQSKIELSAESEIQNGLQDLGKVSFNFGIRSQQGDVFKMIGALQVTPFFQLARIQKKWWGPPGVALHEWLEPKPSSLDTITPETARNKPQVADSLYLDLIRDSDTE